MSRAYPSRRGLPAPAEEVAAAGLPRAARAVSSPGGRARLPFSAPRFYVDLVTTKQHRVAGQFGTLLEAMEFFRTALTAAPEVNLRVRESSNFNFVHAFSYRGNVHTHDPPRRLSMHGPGT